LTPSEALRSLIGERSSISFAEYMRFALYDPRHGFYERGGRAGRGADFLTSPEVGPLFGAVIARALDSWWLEAGRPDPFVVVEVGAGPGTLARSIRYAAPECSSSLLYVLVEQSSFQRTLHAEHLLGWMGERNGFELEAFVSSPQSGDGPQFVSTDQLPEMFSGVVLANELLDNLPFDIVRVRSSSSAGQPVDQVVEQLNVSIGPDGEPELMVGPAPSAVAEDVLALAERSPELPADTWFPWHGAARLWLTEVERRMSGGHVLVFDYGAPTSELAHRPDMGWLRTFRDQQRGSHPLDDPGAQDITTDVGFDQLQLRSSAEITTQAAFLRLHGIDELVEQGRAVWSERAHIADLAAIRGRSAVREAEALLDPDGLGAFVAMHWSIDG
jgi:SAM-dependent MidA family methyltransferase